jgi:hypothetical protein
MSRQALNEAFARTSFLQGANAAYIEQMQAQYEQNPGSVTDEWRLFFQNLQEQAGDATANAEGASWGRTLDSLQSDANRDVVAALTGDYAGVERHLSEQIQSRAHHGRAVDGRVAARNARLHPRADADPRLPSDGPSGANLDPLGLSERSSIMSWSRKPTASPKPTWIGRFSSTACSALKPRRSARSWDSAAHLLPAHRRRVHAHLESGSEVLDSGAHRGRRKGHLLHRWKARRPSSTS